MSKYISFCPDVYLVEGFKRHCIYDLANNNLYNISGEAKDFIKYITQSSISIARLRKNQRAFLDSLIDNKILQQSDLILSFPDIRKVARIYPSEFAWIEVTRKCNLNCHFCYAQASSRCSNTMSIEDFLKVKDQLKKIGINKIQLIGGEPLLILDNLKIMIQACRNDFSFIEVFSNGTLLDDKLCEFFKEYNIHVAISIHSYITEEHDKTTMSNGSHLKAIEAITMLGKHKIKYRIATIKTTQCKVGNKPDNCAYTLRPNNVRLAGRGSIDQYDFAMFKEKAITKNMMRYKFNKDFVVKNVSGHRCFMKNLYIANNLDVFPCVMERRFKHGNLKSRSLDAIIKENIRMISKDQVEGCRDCEYRYACFDCRPDSNGDKKYAKPWYCTYDPYTAKWANLKQQWNKLFVAKE